MIYIKFCVFTCIYPSVYVWTHVSLLHRPRLDGSAAPSARWTVSAGSGRYNVPPTQPRSLQASDGLLIVRFRYRLERVPSVPWRCLVETEAAEHPGRRLSETERRTGLIMLETPFRCFRSGNPPAARGGVGREGALLPGDRAEGPRRCQIHNSYPNYMIRLQRANNCY